MASDAPASSPLLVFQSWYKETEENSTSWALKPQNASLSTCAKEGQPSSRMVTTRLTTERDGFIFCTYASSMKAKELSVNPNASLLFYWTVPAVRQVRVEGKVVQLSEKDASDEFRAYSDYRELQVHLAVQFEILQRNFTGSKAELVKLRKELAENYADESVPIPVPQGWAGYLLVPTRFEFYEHKGAMLHVDKFQYTRTSTEADWTFKLLTYI